MTDIAIRCEGLSKLYRIGEQERYKALRDVITDAAAAPFRRVRSALGNGVRRNGSVTHDSSHITHHSDHIWALDDVSFEVKRGEVVGIIGRNGAGKSTLLKILSRITKPTKGHASIHGRVGSLLEVGTGFHPELTGRENIYLNAAILGMRKTEVARKFDEIVAFAEVEKFIDTPVKRYSSGMYVRLAFAVAAHMETEVLLVDEVLAVGDVTFQKKCLGKMGDVAKQGRTVLFVSHNMGSVMALCSRGILLADGQLALDSDAISTCTKYLNSDCEIQFRHVPFNSRTDARLSFVDVAVGGPHNSPSERLQIDDQIKVSIRYRISTPVTGVVVGIRVHREGVLLFNSFDTDENPERLGVRLPGLYETTLELPRSLLGAGRYRLSLMASVPATEKLDDRPDALTFDIEEETHDLGFKSYARARGSMLIVPIKWKLDNSMVDTEPKREFQEQL